MTGIPLEAYEYVVNGKPALEWVMVSIITKIATQNCSKRANHYHHIRATGFSYISHIINS